MDHRNPQHSPGVGGRSHGAHVCTKCGWTYPNPHPSAKNRRAHKKVCGTIKGYELLESGLAKQTLDSQEPHCFDDEQKTPSPRVFEKSHERIGDASEEDVFADAVCEFSSTIVSDSFKKKEEGPTIYAPNSTKTPGENQQCSSPSTGCVMKSSEMVQESCQVPPVESLENYDVPSSVEATSDKREGGENSTEGHCKASETLIESFREPQVIEGGDVASNVGLKTQGKVNLLDESQSKLASASVMREDTPDSSWNDEVIYSDVEGPSGVVFETISLIHTGEADCTLGENAPVGTSLGKANAAQVISISQSVPDNVHLAEITDFSLHGTKSLDVESNQSVNPCLPETPKGEECKSDPYLQAENLGIQRESLGNGTEVPSSDKLLLEDKTEPQAQTTLGSVKEYPSAENIVISKTYPENIQIKAEEGESTSDAVEETVESKFFTVPLPAVDFIVADSTTVMSLAANKTGVVNLADRESELVQANVVAEEGNIPNRKISSESSLPVSVVLEADDASNQRQNSAETSKGSTLKIGVETCKSNDEVHGGINRGEIVGESSFISVTNTKDDPISHSRSIDTAPDNTTVKTANQKLLESGRTDFNRVVGGLGVIQGNEIDGIVTAHNFYAEVPVTIESNDHRDFGRLQNLSEEHIRSLVSSPLVTRTSTSHAFESNYRSVSGLSGEADKSENASQSSSLAVALSKNQEITMEKITSWSTVNEQHVPLKNLLSEARSPKLQLEAKKDHESNIPRVSSILGQATSPEDDRWPERREVSEEWNSPAKYPVDLKREERKVKGRPFWVPFVCCSNVN